MKALISVPIILVLVAVAHALTATQIAQVVNAHNAERAVFGLAPVTYNASIEQIAQTYVDGCPSGHSGASGLGENMYWGSSQDLTSAVNLWAAEKQYWNCTSNTCCQGATCSWYPCGHFTQIVWSSSTQIGCGIKLCGSWYTVVCNYYRPGNWNCNPFCDRPFPLANCPASATAPQVTPVTTTPVTSTPVAAPRAAPVAVPVAAPRAAPVATPVAAPRAAPVAAPVRIRTPRPPPIWAPRAPVAAPRTASSSNVNDETTRVSDANQLVYGSFVALAGFLVALL